MRAGTLRFLNLGAAGDVFKFGSMKMASNLATDLSFLNDLRGILNARNVGF